MAQRYDALVAREYKAADGSTKTAFTRIGAAFPSKSGDGITVMLDALPLPGTDGQAKIILSVPKPRDSGSAAQSAGGGSRSRDGDIF